MLPIDNAFTVPGRGTVVIGTLQRGVIKKNDECELLGFDAKIKTTISDVQVFKKSIPQVIIIQLRVYLLSLFLENEIRYHFQPGRISVDTKISNIFLNI